MSVEWCRLVPRIHTLRWLLVPVLGCGLAVPATPTASAQSLPNQGLVVRDGTLGSAPAGVVPSGPDDLGIANYLIRADLGEQHGGNLFHSFARFSIGSGERATFIADGAPNPDALENVISRVTGGSPSEIRGVLHSTIPGADVWLLNPNGVVFGAGAQLDVPGSFHASTSDSLGFGEGGLERFYSDSARPSVLSTATPMAFGFLSENGAALLTVEGGLSVTRGEALLAGGGVSLTGADLRAPGAHLSLEAPDKVALSDASTLDVSGARSGSVAIQAGRLVMQEGSRVLAESESDAGTIAIDADSVTLAGGAAIRANGNAGTIAIDAGSVILEGGGSIAANGSAGTINILDAGSLVIHGGFLIAETFGAGSAGAINILDVGSLVIESGIIATSTYGAGSAGKITVRADSVTIGPGPPGLDQPAFISASSFGSASPDSAVGKAGDIEVEAKSILLTNEGGEQRTLEEILLQPTQPLLLTGIFSSTVQGGSGGSIRLTAPEITVTEGAGVATSTVSGGDAGTIELRGDRILVTRGGWVDSTSLPNPDPRLRPGGARDSGDAGIVKLDANEWIEVSGHSDEFGVARVSSVSLGSGAAGEVTLHAPRIAIDGGAVLTTALPSPEQREGTRGGAIRLDAVWELLVTNGGRVDASTFIAGAGGRIDATAGQAIQVEGPGSGIASRTGGIGVGGSVALMAPQIDLRQGGELSAESAPGVRALERIFATGIGEGLIGTVTSDPSQVTGNAGSIELAANRVLLDGGTIATNAVAADGGNVDILAKQLLHLDRGVVTATVTDDTGGNITIDPEVVLLENESRIEARAGSGTGGRIQITADNYFAFPGNVVDASSDLGIDGTVEVHAPDVDLAGDLTALPTTYLDAASQMRERCAARTSGERAGSFAVRGAGGIPPEPDGWLRASVDLETVESSATMSGDSARVASLPAPLFPRGSCPKGFHP